MLLVGGNQEHPVGLEENDVDQRPARIGFVLVVEIGGCNGPGRPVSCDVALVAKAPREPYASIAAER
jgi:hypothetical protein